MAQPQLTNEALLAIIANPETMARLRLLAPNVIPEDPVDPLAPFMNATTTLWTAVASAPAETLAVHAVFQQLPLFSAMKEAQTAGRPPTSITISPLFAACIVCPPSSITTNINLKEIINQIQQDLLATMEPMVRHLRTGNTTILTAAETTACPIGAAATRSTLWQAARRLARPLGFFAIEKWRKANNQPTDNTRDALDRALSAIGVMGYGASAPTEKRGRE